VVVGVPGGVHHPQSHRAGGEHVAVGDRSALVGDGVPGWDGVLGADRAGQFQPAGHVVVVDVALGHEGDADGPLLGERKDPVDVALGVDDHADTVGADQVAAVAEPSGLDDVDLHVKAPQYGTG
jgi:hypothetical protein